MSWHAGTCQYRRLVQALSHMHQMCTLGTCQYRRLVQALSHMHELACWYLSVSQSGEGPEPHAWAGMLVPVSIADWCRPWVTCMSWHAGTCQYRRLVQTLSHMHELACWYLSVSKLGSVLLAVHLQYSDIVVSMPSSGILRRAALVRTDVSEERNPSIIRVTIGLSAHRILSLTMEAMRSSETSVLTRATRRRHSA
jgi:hypothetical protein